MQHEVKTPGPFFHKGGPVGVLMLHGFTGNAYVFGKLAADLTELGYTAYAPLLRGHGTTPEDMETTTAEDWVDSSIEAYDKLCQDCERIYVIGVSFGGLIAASLSLRRKVAGIIMVGTPLTLQHQNLMRLGTVLFPLLRRRFYVKGTTRIGVKYYEKTGNDLGEGDSVFAGGNHSYRKMPVACVRHMLKYLKTVRREVLANVSAPVLIIQSRNDEMVNVSSGNLLLQSLSSVEKTLIWTEHPHHRMRDVLSEPETFGEIIRCISAH